MAEQHRSTEVLEHRVSSLERAYTETSVAVKGINESLRALAALDARHLETRNDVKRVTDSLKDHEMRIRSVEGTLPATKLVTKYVVIGATGILGLIGTAAFKIIFGA